MSKANTVSPSQRTIQLRQAFKLALSIVLLYWLALWLNWDMPKYGALAIALISLDTTGASLQKGLMRIVGTTAGLAIGLLGLALFAQASWLTLLYHVSYLIFVGYFMQKSRYPYAWYVAGFLPTLVWATTYGKIYNAFDYATFRYLETSAGIVIFTMVSVILWPRQAGDQLRVQGHNLWQGLHDLFGMYRRQLEDGQRPVDAAKLRTKLAGTTAQLRTTLEAAYVDTPAVASQKRAWEAMRVNVRALCDAMELWRQSIDDWHRLKLDRLLPQVRSATERVDQRLARIDHLWRVWSAEEEATDMYDGAVLEPLQLEVDPGAAPDLSHLDRATLLSFVRQLKVLDLTSRELLRTMRVLAGVAPVRDLKSQALPADLYRPSRWDPTRLVNGLLPAVCLTVGYFFWIHFNPPTGPSIPNMAVTFALMVLLTPMRILNLIPIVLIAIGGLIAPIYFLVMPRLGTGMELSMLVFCYTFACNLFTGRLAPLRSMAVILFVMMTGISNQQSYSFTGLVDGAQMMMLAIGIVAVVQTLVSPARPEQVLLSSVRRFFRGCAGVTRGFALTVGSSEVAKGRRLRKRYFQSMVLPASVAFQNATQHLDYKLYPDNSPDKVQRLYDSLQSVAYRLQSLEIAHRRLTTHSFEFSDSFMRLTRRVRETIQTVFDRWTKLERSDELEHEALQRLSRDVEQQFQDMATSTELTSDSLNADLYTMLGSARGLIESMADAQGAINQINWRQWAMPRF